MIDLSPGEVMEQVASAVPPECREHIIVVGSLAAGYQLMRHDRARQIRTKDVDCVLFPQVEAVGTGKVVAESLMARGWGPATDGEFGKPGSASTPDEMLPAVRLYPPESRAWFLELLSVPGPGLDAGKRWRRLELESGHYGLPSYRFMSVATWNPLKTETGLYCARPEFMALSLLLEHQEVTPARILAPVQGRSIKRSNKDLGRVIALARLSGDDAVEQWPESWVKAVDGCFPGRDLPQAATLGRGLRALLGSPSDMEEAHHTCMNSLLAHTIVTVAQLRIAGERLIQDAVEPFEKIFKGR
jgi:hypothetical protein